LKGTGADDRGGGGGATGDAPVEVTAQSVCARIYQLQAEGCDLVEGYSLTEDECVTDYTRSLEERGDAAVRDLSQQFDKWSPASFKLTAPEKGKPFTADGYVVEGSGDTVTVTVPGKGAQSCKA